MVALGHQGLNLGNLARSETGEVLNAVLGNEHVVLDANATEVKEFLWRMKQLIQEAM